MIRRELTEDELKEILWTLDRVSELLDPITPRTSECVVRETVQEVTDIMGELRQILLDG